MPNDDTNQNNTVHNSGADLKTPLQDMRARVATLCQRIKASKDPDAIREVQEQLGRVGDVMDQRRPRPRKRRRRGRHG